MLTLANYNNLWTATLGLPIQNIPCYYQYLQREVYYQDYLDLFCCPKNGNPTYERISVNGHHTVLIPNLQPDPNGAYTVIDSAEHVRLIVDYDFPYYGELCKNRDIKYILIGEAPPAPSFPILVTDKDKENSYFYNVKHLKSTSYLNEPIKAFNVRGREKEEKLIGLADKGILLIDLSIFAISYSQNSRTIIGSILLPELIARIQSLNCLNPQWDFCLVAPQTTSVTIINEILINHNGLLINKSIFSNQDLLNSPVFNNNNNYTSNPNAVRWPNITHVSKRAKFTALIGNPGPNAQLIKRAFNLP